MANEKYTFLPSSTATVPLNLQKHLIDYAGCTSTETNYMVSKRKINYTAYNSRMDSDPWIEEDKPGAEGYNPVDLFGISTGNGIKPATKPQFANSVQLNGDTGSNTNYYVLRREDYGEVTSWTYPCISIYPTNSDFDITGKTPTQGLTLTDPDDSTKHICPEAVYVILQGSGGGGGYSKSKILVDCGGGGGGGSGAVAGAIITFNENSAEWYVTLGKPGTGSGSGGGSSWLSSSTHGAVDTASYLQCGHGVNGGNAFAEDQPKYGAGGAGGAGSTENHYSETDKHMYANYAYNGVKGGDAGKESSSAGEGISSGLVFYCTNVASDKVNVSNKKARAASSNTGGDPGTAYHGTRWFGAGGGGGSSFMYKGGAGGNGEGAGEPIRGTDGSRGSGGGGAGGNKNTGTVTQGGDGGISTLYIYYGYNTK